MKTQRIGIIMNGITGRMGTNQHLIRSIKAIRDEGGVKVGNALILMPDPILTGRNHDKLKAPPPPPTPGLRRERSRGNEKEYS